jgi:hypothetical protein
VPRHQNPRNSSEFLGEFQKIWKTVDVRETQLTYYIAKAYINVDHLVCNQEVAGSIPVVST